MTISIRLRSTLLAAALALAAPLTAQTTLSDTTSVYVLETVTVTTTRSATDRTGIPQKIEVVTMGDMERTGSRSAAEALRSTTPIDVIEYPGLLSGVSIRGFRPQISGISPRTLILLDGRPAGTINVALLHAGQIERIEVLRGPASAIYGSSAMGGVVNVISRRSVGPPSGSFSTGYGTFGTYEMGFYSGGTLSTSLDFDLGVATVGQRAGYRIGSHRTFAGDSLVKTLPDGTTTRVPWVTADSVVSFSEFRSYSGSARIGYALDDRWRLDLRGEAYRADDVQNPGDLHPQDWDGRTLKDVARGSVDLEATGALGNHLTTARLYAAREVIDYFDSPEPPQYVNFRTPVPTFGLQVQDAIRFARHHLVVGLDYTAAATASEAFEADGTPRAPFSPDLAVRSTAAFAQSRFELLDGRLIGSAGARFDRVRYEVLETPHLAGYPSNEEQHSVVTPSAGVRYSLLPGVQVYGNLGRGFVTPDAFNVAGYNERRAGEGRRSVHITRGNPALSPETSRSWDAGLAIFRPRGGVDFEMTYFHADVRDRITSQFITGSGAELTVDGDTILSTTTYLNVDEAEIHGLEGRIAYDLAAALGRTGSVRLFANGTRILRAQERSTGTSSLQRIRNVADLTVVAGVEFDHRGRWSGRFAGRYVGERTDSDYVALWEPGELLYPAYLVFDLTAAVRVHDRFRFGLEVRNLGDEDYFEVRGYNLPGRAFRLTLGASF